MSKQELEAAVKTAEAALAEAQQALAAWDTAPENNVFESLEQASGELEDRLLGWAHADCEGSYNFSNDEYTQEFIVDGKHYLATLTCEYNRHDKSYYYVDGSSFEITPL